MDRLHLPGRLAARAGRSEEEEVPAVYLGLEATTDELGITASTTFSLAGFDHDRLGPRRDEIGDPRAIAITCYSLADPSFSPPGTTHLVLMDLQYSEPWTRLSPAEYLNVKFAYGSKLIDFAERTIPGLRDTIVEADVATPVTVMRYLRHPGGAIYGFDQTPSGLALFRGNDVVVPGLHLAGAWTGTGGFEPTLTAGAAAAEAVLDIIGRKGHGTTGATR